MLPPRSHGREWFALSRHHRQSTHGLQYDADEARQVQYLEALHTRLQVTDLPQKLKAIPKKRPDLLGVILKEGTV